MWYEEKLNAIARQLHFCYISAEIKFKASITFLNVPAYIITRKEYFSFLVLHRNSGVLRVTIVRKIVLYFPAERAESLLPPLWSYYSIFRVGQEVGQIFREHW
jgi:hypothetical protein